MEQQTLEVAHSALPAAREAAREREATRERDAEPSPERLPARLADGLADGLAERDGFDSAVANHSHSSYGANGSSGSHGSGSPLVMNGFNGASANGTANSTTNGALNGAGSHGASANSAGLNSASLDGTASGAAAASGVVVEEVPSEVPSLEEASAVMGGARVVGEAEILRSLEGLKPQLREVETEIERMVSASVKTVADVASHTLGAGGKRLRPALTILSALLCDARMRTGALSDKVLSGAVAVELTHTTTLLHDDVVDGAQVRRGKPAANLLWGNGLSVLVGDYLFAQVFLIASQQGFYELMNPLAKATAQMCAGELLEVQKRRDLSISEEEYEEIVALKTAALTECSCRIGALAAEGSEEQSRRLAAFGYNIGIAFQIVDDVFDVASSRERIGKPVGNDIREGVVTLPMLRAMNELNASEQDELGALLGKDPIEDADVARALELIRSTNAIESSRRTALEYVARAKAQLEVFDDCAARSMLFDIADYVVSRAK